MLLYFTSTDLLIQKQLNNGVIYSYKPIVDDHIDRNMQWYV
jgi:hypothetical protein